MDDTIVLGCNSEDQLVWEIDGQEQKIEREVVYKSARAMSRSIKLGLGEIWFNTERNTIVLEAIDGRRVEVHHRDLRMTQEQRAAGEVRKHVFWEFDRKKPKKVKSIDP